MRHIAVITGGRMTYGYSRPVMREIEKHPDIDYSLIVTNQHLLPTFGLSVEEIEDDGFNITDKIYMALDGYSPATMVKSLGVFMLGVTDALVRMKPDIVLVVGDRGEHFVAAMAGAHMNIPVAHIQAGELSGNIDGMTRHAIARYAHIHFASNEDAAERLKRSGEQEFRVFMTGAPQLDELVNGHFISSEKTARKFNLDLKKPIVLFVQHPVTEEFGETGFQMRETLEAIKESKHQTVAIFPNNDAGSDEARRIIENYKMPFMRVERNLPREEYLGLMRVASVMVGNSSGGLIEAPVFKLPAVNVGERQRDRYRGKNVIDVPPDRNSIQNAIVNAILPEFRESLNGSGSNPYFGDGKVSGRIVNILRTVKIDEQLLKKQLTF
ncbi:MAG: UDP-N-acetylglucosamine 2-epimerase (hydrolyzing) [Nitrospinaceae bacterium]|nr:UDP-N-acetylglucosamine 2-epimerase (hydrolyzing) [Nitrospinaceae bacterium]